MNEQIMTSCFQQHVYFHKNMMTWHLFKKLYGKLIIYYFCKLIIIIIILRSKIKNMQKFQK